MAWIGQRVCWQSELTQSALQVGRFTSRTIWTEIQLRIVLGHTQRSANPSPSNACQPLSRGLVSERALVCSLSIQFGNDLCAPFSSLSTVEQRWIGSVNFEACVLVDFNSSTDFNKISIDFIVHRMEFGAALRNASRSARASGRGDRRVRRA